MHWTLHWAVEGHRQTHFIRPKHTDAATVDPVRLTPKFVFDTNDAEALATKDQLDDVLGYGGQVEVADRFIEGIDIDASDEARLLLGGIQAPGTFLLKAELTTFDRPIRATIEVPKR